MRKEMLLIMLVALMITPIVSYGETKAVDIHSNPLLLAQNENYIACYKQVDMEMVLFRWCHKDFPWTATNIKRTNCYATSEACAKAEMPQSWCIK